MATFILSVGLAAVAIGLQHATSGIETGKGETTAAFLAEQRLEQLKALALADWPSPILSAGTTAEDYGSLPDASPYRRVTTITDGPGWTCTAQLQAGAGHGPLPAGHGRGQLDQERRLEVVTMLVSRS